MRKVITIDCDYVRPRFAAAYLVQEGNEGYFVEANTQYAVPKLLEALRGAGLEPSQIRTIVITHVHLDHSGGAYELMAACPQATLVCHPRAARHIIDPSRLEKSARQVYGDAEFDRLYGRLRGVEASRVREVADGEKLSFASGELEVLHTRGHANHHLCLIDRALDAVFTGDSFGLAYPDLQREGLFIFPSTSPTDFDAGEAIHTVDRLVGLGVSRAFLTHFGELTDLAGASKQLKKCLEFSGNLVERARNSALIGAALVLFCQRELNAFFDTMTTQRAWIQMDLDINAAGLAFVAEKSRLSGSG